LLKLEKIYKFLMWNK